MQKKTSLAFISLFLLTLSPANSNPTTNHSNVTNFESFPVIDEGEKIEHKKPLIFTTKKSKKFKTLITANSKNNQTSQGTTS